jgi:endoglucanase
MSIFTAAHVAHVQTPLGRPTWNMTLVSGAEINEGGSTTMSLRVDNFIRGTSRAIWWMTGKSAEDGRWLKSWATVMKEALEPYGIRVQRLTKVTSPEFPLPAVGTCDMQLWIPADSIYNGEVITWTNTSRINRRDDPDPSTAQCVLFKKVVSTDADTSRGIGNVITIHDTSKRPTGTPTFQLSAFAEDGVSPSPAELKPGASVVIEFKPLNIIPGTKFKTYAANEGQRMIGFRESLLAAIRAYPYPGLTYEETRYPPPEGQSWYNGYTLVYGSNYDETKPLRVKLTCTQAPDDGTGVQVDVVAPVVREGTADEIQSYKNRGDWNENATYVLGDWVTYIPNGVKYIVYSREFDEYKGIVPTNTAYWREYVPVQVLGGSKSFYLKAEPAKFWEIRATSDRSTITYKISGPRVNTGKPFTSVQLESTNAPPGFMNAMIAAGSVPGAPIAYNASTNTFTSSATSIDNQSISWTVPHAGSGKHVLKLVNEQGNYVTIRYGCVLLSPIPPAPGPTYVAGVNASSGEFGTDPGKYSTNYVYPSRPEMAEPRKHESLNYIWNLGVRHIRLPFKWGRIQKEDYGPLFGEKDPAASWGGQNNEYDIARIDEIIQYWTVTLGGSLLLDLHNFGSARTNGGKVRYDPDADPTGESRVSETLLDVWVRLSNRYANNPKIWLGLMNEPNGATAWSADRCRTTFQNIVNGIRALTDNGHKILVAGTEYSHTANWIANGQAEAYQDFYDPANNFAFETHNYFDANKSGTSGLCTPDSNLALVAATNWAREHGYKLFMGEIAGGNPKIGGQATCGIVTPKSYQYMQSNKDVWLGWTSWGYGPYWPAAYIFNLNPTDYHNPVEPSEQMKMLLPYIAYEG